MGDVVVAVDVVVGDVFVSDEFDRVEVVDGVELALSLPPPPPPPPPPASAAAPPATATPPKTQPQLRLNQLGSGAVGLYRKLLNTRSPQDMLAEIDAATAANEARSGDLSARLEKTFGEIAAKKKVWAVAPPARKRILEDELRTMLATYTAAEREQRVLLENRRVLAQVRGRMLEATAYDMAGVTELQIDELVDRIDEKAGAAEGRVDAARDLENAGRRRERESDRESFLDQLGQFDAEPGGEPGLAAALDAFGDEPAPPKPVREPDREPPV